MIKELDEDYSEKVASVINLILTKIIKDNNKKQGSAVKSAEPCSIKDLLKWTAFLYLIYASRWARIFPSKRRLRTMQALPNKGASSPKNDFCIRTVW